MTSTLLQPVADQLAAVIEGLNTTPAFNVPRTTDGMNAWAPKALGGPGPWAVIEIPDVTRTPLDQAEITLGVEDWYLTYDVTLYFDFKVLERDQIRAVDLLEAVIAGIDDSDGLGIDQIGDVKVTRATKAYDLSDDQRPLLAYECEVQVWFRRPTT